MKNTKNELSGTEKTVVSLVLALAFLVGVLGRGTVELQVPPAPGCNARPEAWSCEIEELRPCPEGCHETGVQYPKCICTARPRVVTGFSLKDFGRAL